MPAPVPDRSSGPRVAHSTSAIELVTRNENVEDVQAQVEKLGRQRPEVFKTFWHELGFCFSLLASMLMAEYFISGFNIILPVLAEALEIPEQSRTWPASIFSLITGSLLLPVGRLADMYGGYVLFTFGLTWFFIWSLIGGFSQNYIMLILCRALQGIGAAAFLPSGIMLLGKIYRPGPRKNLMFSLYGSASPLGFFSGIFFGGLSGHTLSWRWYFWIGASLIFVMTVTAFLCVPSDREPFRSPKAKMDWLGAGTVIPGLILVVFALTDSSHAPEGWRTSYILASFLLGTLLLAAAVYVEGWIATNPLLPFDVFQVKYMTPLLLSLFFSYGVFGIYLFYASFYIENVLGASALLTTAWFAPMAAGGLVLATVAGFILHLLPGTILMLLSASGNVLCVLLFAVIPEHPNYWAYVFPAMVGATVGVDIAYSVSNVFITTQTPSNKQGLAGALINSTLFLGISFFLGIADIVVEHTRHLGPRKSYKLAFWFGTGCAGVALLLLVLFVRIEKAKSDLTFDEKAELEDEVKRRSLVLPPSDAFDRGGWSEIDVTALPAVR